MNVENMNIYKMEDRYDSIHEKASWEDEISESVAFGITLPVWVSIWKMNAPVKNIVWTSAREYTKRECGEYEYTS